MQNYNQVFKYKDNYVYKYNGIPYSDILYILNT